MLKIISKMKNNKNRRESRTIRTLPHFCGNTNGYDHFRKCCACILELHIRIISHSPDCTFFAWNLIYVSIKNLCCSAQTTDVLVSRRVSKVLARGWLI